MLQGDRLVCAFVQPHEVGTQFMDWFLHVTIVPWFRASLASEKLTKELQESYTGSHPFDVRVGDEAHFGYKKRKLVNLIESPELMRLEGQTRRTLHAHKAWVVDEADKTRKRPYVPHVTAQHEQRMYEGDTFCIDKLYIVEQKGDYKQITAEISLG